MVINPRTGFNSNSYQLQTRISLEALAAIETGAKERKMTVSSYTRFLLYEQLTDMGIAVEAGVKPPLPRKRKRQRARKTAEASSVSA